MTQLYKRLTELRLLRSYTIGLEGQKREGNEQNRGICFHFHWIIYERSGHFRVFLIRAAFPFPRGYGNGAIVEKYTLYGRYSISELFGKADSTPSNVDRELNAPL